MKLNSFSITFVLATLAHATSAADTPKSPRATLGDSVVEPAWDQRLTVTVGPSSADLVGTTEKAIQAAVDYVARFGGGTVQILPGTYRLRNAVYLQSKVRVAGSGSATVLIKEPSVTTTLAADSDRFDQKSAHRRHRFCVGDGVCLHQGRGGKPETVKRTLTLRPATASSSTRACAKISGGSATPRSRPCFRFSGEPSRPRHRAPRPRRNRANNGNLTAITPAASSAGVHCVVMRGVTARNYNGDGLSCRFATTCSWKIAQRRSRARPASGFAAAHGMRNRLVGNHIGLLLGVRQGLARKITSGQQYWHSIGHRDTTTVRNNDVTGSKKVGLLFRPERGRDFTGDRNRIENNRLVNNGAADGFAVDVQGVTEAIVFAGNEITETRGSDRRTAIRLGPETAGITLRDNRITGFSKNVEGEPATPARR